MRHLTSVDAPATALRGASDPHWRDHAACREMDLAESERLFFCSTRARRTISEAKTWCQGCPVRQDCLQAAIEEGLGEGIRGGLTATERRPLHADWNQRFDASRILRAFWYRRDVVLNTDERDALARLAHLAGWTPDRLAQALKVGPKFGGELLLMARADIEELELPTTVTALCDHIREQHNPQPKTKDVKRRRGKKAAAAARVLPFPVAAPTCDSRWKAAA
ncbi:WhiB family transcriptional regulator [Streptomyces sp. NPDC050085]|uniref:WhiB family transcriptional regulator n=1 Tax=Streptomyces sp. NPDC050085 TaxID=3365600 RepID=UPI0037A145DE